MKHRRIFVAVCAVLLLIGISACSSTPADTSLVGSWEYTVKYDKIWEDYGGEAKDFFDLSELSFTMEMEFTEDGAFTCGYNEESIENFGKDIRAAYEKGLEPYLSYVIGQSNPGMTVEEALSATGMSKDDLLDEMMAQGADLTDLETFAGTYQIQENKLCLTYTEGAEVNETLKFQCSGDTLILDVEGDTANSLLKYLFPATFTRKQ